MSDILSKVTPLTRGIIWIQPQEVLSENRTYKAIDYLLNGLLTASLKSGQDSSGRVLISTNFHFQLYVFIANKFIPKEYDSFLQLLKKDLSAESTVLVIDENDAFNELLSKTPEDIRSILHLYK